MGNNRLISKTWQRFKSQRNNVFTEEINQTALNLNDDKRIQSMDWIETYPYGTSEDFVHEIEDIKYDNIMKIYKK